MKNMDAIIDFIERSGLSNLAYAYGVLYIMTYIIAIVIVSCIFYALIKGLKK